MPVRTTWDIGRSAKAYVTGSVPPEEPRRCGKSGHPIKALISLKALTTNVIFELGGAPLTSVVGGLLSLRWDLSHEHIGAVVSRAFKARWEAPRFWARDQLEAGASLVGAGA